MIPDQKYAMKNQEANNRIWAAFKSLLSAEIDHLTTFHRTDRLWQLPLAAALAVGLPLLIGTYFNRLSDGLVASLGGLSLLLLPDTRLSHRMVTMMACAFAMVACYTLGIVGHFFQLAMTPLMIGITLLVMLIIRSYQVGPPGGLFFVMVAAIGAYTPLPAERIPHMIGLISMGSSLACIIAFLYSLYSLRLRAPRPTAPLVKPDFDFVVLDAVAMSLFVGLSIALAQALQLQRPYWVPVSCLAIIQGASLRAIWTRQVHRILGTALGMLLAWVLLLQPLTQWTICLALMVLMFAAEMLVVRHYAIAFIFVTPLTILLAEAANFGNGSAGALISARFIDTLCGCAVGFLGGACIHSPRFRGMLARPLRWLMSAWPKKVTHE